MPNTDTKRQLNTLLPTPIWDRIVAAAARAGLSRSEYVARYLTDRVGDHDATTGAPADDTTRGRAA